MRTCAGCGRGKKGRVGFLSDGCLGGERRERLDDSPLEAMAPDWCDECGARHSAERRQRVIARMLPASAGEIAEEWTCLYPDFAKGSASARRLFRDLNAIGAERGRAIRDPWTLPPRCLDCGHRHGGRAYGLCLVDGCDCVAARKAA